MIIGGESGDVNVPSQVFGFVYGGKYKNTFVNLKRSLGIGAEGDYSCFDGQAFSVDTLEFWAQKGSGFGPKQLNHLVKTIHADDLSCYEILSQSGGVDDGQIVSCITVQLFLQGWGIERFGDSRKEIHTRQESEG
jgi:hypothetical protein